MTKVPDRPVADIVILIHFTGYSMTVDKISKKPWKIYVVVGIKINLCYAWNINSLQLQYVLDNSNKTDLHFWKSM